jgi:hypothetical protein
MMLVRVTHIDGKLPNLALMRVARHHRDRGDTVVFSRRVERDMLEPDYDAVYGSAIFSYSAGRVAIMRENFPKALIGGTWNTADNTTVESVLGLDGPELFDYSIYPTFTASIGFTQRGCRLKCGFCVVPKKEGRPRSVNTIADIWRGGDKPRHLHLLDNDFFGQPRDQWEARMSEIIAGGFRVCLNQGINIRMVDADSAKALSSIKYYDDAFSTRRLYTAWDNIGDEERFFAGVDLLADHGVPPTHLLVYMLIGYDKRETWLRIFHRFNKMVARGIRPYPMVYGDRDRRMELGGHNANIADRTLGEFQRWVIRKAYTFVPFEHYDVNAKGRPSKGQLDLL